MTEEQQGTVYVVTADKYGAHQILGVYTNKDAAEARADTYNQRWSHIGLYIARVQKYPLDATNIPRDNFPMFHVRGWGKEVSASLEENVTAEGIAKYSDYSWGVYVRAEGFRSAIELAVDIILRYRESMEAED